MNPLRRRMIDDMQIRNLTPNTQRVRHRLSGSPATFASRRDILGPDEIRTYLIHLTQERRLPGGRVVNKSHLPMAMIRYQSVGGCADTAGTTKPRSISRKCLAGFGPVGLL